MSTHQNKEVQKIYEAKFVEELFDKMSASYPRMNYITSFGFSEQWRRRCVEELGIKPGAVVVDLMTGMGECWKYILSTENEVNKLVALDFSTEMIKRAHRNKEKYASHRIEIRKENVFDNGIQGESADYIVSGFGLKTFNEKQLKKLALEIDRLLKPQGRFSLIDVSVPKNKVLRSGYMFYLKNVIPVLGRLFLGNPETYRMLGVYTEAFNNAKKVRRLFEEQGFEVEYVSYFYGCASGIKGVKKHG